MNQLIKDYKKEITTMTIIHILMGDQSFIKFMKSKIMKVINLIVMTLYILLYVKTMLDGMQFTLLALINVKVPYSAYFMAYKLIKTSSTISFYITK